MDLGSGRKYGQGVRWRYGVRGEYMWQGFIILHNGMVLKAVNGVSRFMTKVGDVFSRDKLDIKFRLYKSRGPFWGLHSSQEYYFGFCPINRGFQSCLNLAKMNLK